MTTVGTTTAPRTGDPVTLHISIEDGSRSTEPDDWRGLADRLRDEPDLGPVRELRPPVGQGELGADLLGVLVEVGVAAVATLGVVLEAWLRQRGGSFKVTWEREDNDTRVHITLEGTNAQGAATARALLDDLNQAMAAGTETTGGPSDGHDDHGGQDDPPPAPGPAAGG